MKIEQSFKNMKITQPLKESFPLNKFISYPEIIKTVEVTCKMLELIY